MTKKYDIVVFGASGFTGKYVVAELFRKQCHKDYQIAIAGRDALKLRAVSEWMKTQELLAGDPDIIEANTDNHMSLVSMCMQTKAVLNCVGPYRFHGEAVVKACLEGGSDYLDITGEPEFMERMRSKYHDAAMQKGVYIILACGFDCIPSELGMIYAKNKFSGTLGSVENYFQLTTGDKGMVGNYGTYSSLVNSISSASSLRSTRRSQSKRYFPVCGPKLKLKHIHYEGEKRYALAFFGADVSVVRRSQRFFFEQRNEIPAQFLMYFSTDFFKMVCIILFMFVLKVMTTFSYGTKLMLDHPRFFTGDFFNKNGPSKEQIAGAGFKFTMHCKGYKKILTADESDTSEPYDSKMVAKITGPEIGYALTPIALVQGACCVLDERRLLPANGGVYTPGPAFRDTSMIERLNDNGVHFSIMEDQKSIS